MEWLRLLGIWQDTGSFFKHLQTIIYVIQTVLNICQHRCVWTVVSTYANMLSPVRAWLSESRAQLVGYYSWQWWCKRRFWTLLSRFVLAQLLNLPNVFKLLRNIWQTKRDRDITQGRTRYLNLMPFQTNWVTYLDKRCRRQLKNGCFVCPEFVGQVN